jgi:hypothetical protein
MAIAGVFCAALLALWVFETEPYFVKRELTEIVLWALVMLASFAGWGSLLDRSLFARRADLGLRMLWGASGVLFVGGIASATSLVSRGLIMILLLGGVLSLAFHAVRERDVNLASLRFAIRALRRNGLVTTMLIAVLLGVLIRAVGGAADVSTNPYDDDVAYLPMIKRLVQTGTLIEPFSFRRLSTLGGTTFFQALLTPHVSYRHINTFDRGVCVALIAALIVFFRSEKRRPPLFVTALVLGFVVCLKNTSINTAAHYAGVAFFLGTFRTLAWMRDDDPLTAKAIPLALVAAATCTLRQNYLSVPVTMIAVSYAYRAFATSARARPWSERLREPLVVAAASFVALLPWFVLAYRSNHTFLFPLQNGTYRSALELQSRTSTGLDELRFLVSVALENEPIKALGVIALAGALVREDHPYKPLKSLWIASALGLVILSHAFTLSDPADLGRYLYGFFAALAIATLLTISVAPLARGAAARTRVAAALAVGAILVQLPETRDKASSELAKLVRSVDEERRRPPVTIDTIEGESFAYAELQSEVPPGEAVAVMVDKGYLLDFSRNRIFNIDMPGFASLEPDMPFFRGSEPVAQYFLAHGIRYLMFVRPEFSQYLYQRSFWFDRMFAEEEIWRLVAPYFVDIIDSFTALSRSRRVMKEIGGIVVLDLATPKAHALITPWTRPDHAMITPG